MVLMKACVCVYVYAFTVSSLAFFRRRELVESSIKVVKVTVGNVKKLSLSKRSMTRT